MKVGDLVIVTPLAVERTVRFRATTGSFIFSDELANRKGIILSRFKDWDGFVLTIGFGNTVVRAFQDYFEKFE